MCDYSAALTRSCLYNTVYKKWLLRVKPGGTSVTDFYISDVDIPIYFTILLPQGYSYVHVEQKQEIWGKKN